MTRFEEFKQSAKSDLTNYRQMMDDTKVWEFKEHLKLIQEFQNKVSYRLMNYLFGEQLGPHLWSEFREQNQGNALNWFSRLNGEFYIFVLHEIKNNRTLYAYS